MGIPTVKREFVTTYVLNIFFCKWSHFQVSLHCGPRIPSSIKIKLSGDHLLFVWHNHSSLIIWNDTCNWMYSVHIEVMPKPKTYCRNDWKCSVNMGQNTYSFSFLISSHFLGSHYMTISLRMVTKYSFHDIIRKLLFERISNMLYSTRLLLVWQTEMSL